MYLLKQNGLLKMSLGVYFVPRIRSKTREHRVTKIVSGGKKCYLLLLEEFPPENFQFMFCAYFSWTHIIYFFHQWRQQCFTCWHLAPLLICRTPHFSKDGKFWREILVKEESCWQTQLCCCSSKHQRAAVCTSV